MVTQADNIIRKEHEYMKKLKMKNLLSEKAFDDMVHSNASVRWQDSVNNFQV